MSVRLSLCPRAIDARAAAPAGSLPLAGGARAFAACEAVLYEAVLGENRREVAREVVPVPALADWAARSGPEVAAQATALLERLSAPRAPYAGLDLGRPHVMGVINVTPDSFSDGGDRFDAGRAVDDGLAMIEAGAAILDVGGESTRPGSAPVEADEELRRVLPVVRGLAGAGAPVSIDTRRARVMAAALDAGARIVNDVTALAGDPDSLALVAARRVPVVLMHMRGEPRGMQADPSYDDAPREVYDALAERVAACEAAGIARAHRRRSRHRLRQDRRAQPGNPRPDGALPGIGLRGAARGQPQGLHRQGLDRRGAEATPARLARRGARGLGARRPDHPRPRRGRDGPGDRGVARDRRRRPLIVVEAPRDSAIRRESSPARQPLRPFGTLRDA